jgi:hypothetical protein
MDQVYYTFVLVWAEAPVTQVLVGRGANRIRAQPPQKVACGFPTLRSPEFASQHS